ncbi:MAG: pyruvate kinase [Alphaproteobacteria bacterium]|nr:pyruvate kinase [Alphaproteobacteria bacterium]
MATSNSIEKYFYQNMNKSQGIDHISHRTKIVATVGPSCDSYEMLLMLAQAGVNVFRLNFSHGDHASKKQIISYIKTINKTQPFNIAILADLQGPKLRVGDIENNALEVKVNQHLTFTNTLCVGTKEKIYVSYPNLAKDVNPGEIILIDDGKIEVEIHEILKNGDVKVKVLTDGIISSKKGFNLPETQTSLPALTEKDLEDLEFIMNNDCDWVALSFVRRVDDIRKLREILNKNQSKLKIIAKIEKPEAVKNIRSIILASDGIMIARGDLGVEMPIEEIPLIQKDIIRKCIHRAKPVIVATQMMESMIDRIKPNRSEVTDVANAVIEGTDAVMLSGETATGNHPVKVIEMMVKIIKQIEENSYNYNRSDLAPQLHSPTLLSDAVCYNTCRMANEINANAIIGTTLSGYTAFMLASYRPKLPIFVFTKERSIVNQLSLSFGVRAFCYPEENTIDDIIFNQITILKERGFLNINDIVISTGSTPVSLHLSTNLIKITKVE